MFLLLFLFNPLLLMSVSFICECLSLLLSPVSAHTYNQLFPHLHCNVCIVQLICFLQFVIAPWNSSAFNFSFWLQFVLLNICIEYIWWSEYTNWVFLNHNKFHICPTLISELQNPSNATTQLKYEGQLIRMPCSKAQPLPIYGCPTITAALKENIPLTKSNQ